MTDVSDVAMEVMIGAITTGLGHSHGTEDPATEFGMADLTTPDFIIHSAIHLIDAGVVFDTASSSDGLEALHGPSPGGSSSFGVGGVTMAPSNFEV